MFVVFTFLEGLHWLNCLMTHSWCFFCIENIGVLVLNWPCRSTHISYLWICSYFDFEKFPLADLWDCPKQSQFWKYVGFSKCKCLTLPWIILKVLFQNIDAFDFTFFHYKYVNFIKKMVYRRNIDRIVEMGRQNSSEEPLDFYGFRC